MTEEQKQFTLGQLADTKAELENSIKNMVNDFMNKFGIRNLSMNASFDNYKVINLVNEIEDKHENSIYIDFKLF